MTTPSKANALRDAFRDGKTIRETTLPQATASPENACVIPPPRRVRGRDTTVAVAAKGIVRFVRPWGTFLLVVILILGGLCVMDFGALESWQQACECLPALRENPRNEEAATCLAAVARKVSVHDDELRSGILGVLALRRAGLGPREQGLAELQRIRKQHTQSWLARTVGTNALTAFCTSCSGSGNGKTKCYACKGSGRCVRCGGRRGNESELHNSRPRGDRGKIRNSGAFQSLDSTCLTCRGTGRCMTCGGRGDVSRFCSECGGAGGQFSTAKLSDQYRLAIDHVLAMHSPWVRQALAFRNWLRGFLTPTIRSRT
jgi:hypothetical protein